MRKRIVAGNWKMNTSVAEGIELTREINQLMIDLTDDEVVVAIAPPFSHLSEISKIINPRIWLTAQNCSYEEKGAFTGEISLQMLKSVNCKAVIIGHSERRKYFNETNAELAKKVNLCLKYDLIPIYCCGEELKERETDNHFNIVEKQISEGLFHLKDEEFNKVVIAYEPVWAIGTGVTASPEQAQEMHSFIRNLIGSKYGNNVSGSISLLYGGSCNPGNASSLFSLPDVDGGLIGGASLKAGDFLKIISSFNVN